MISLKECKSYYQENYISRDEAKNIKYFYDEIVNDHHITNIRETKQRPYKFLGSKDRPLRLERDDNPFLSVIEKLKKDFGDFQIDISMSSVIYLYYPFGVHTDIVSSEKLLEQRKKGNKYGQSFIIPLWWDSEYSPGTVFYSSPPHPEENLYIEYQDDLPEYYPEHNEFLKNFSVQSLWKWKNPGDLIAWDHYVWHSTTCPQGYQYTHDKCFKEFIKINTWKI